MAIKYHRDDWIARFSSRSVSAHYLTLSCSNRRLPSKSIMPSLAQCLPLRSRFRVFPQLKPSLSTVSPSHSIHRKTLAPRSTPIAPAPCLHSGRPHGVRLPAARQRILHSHRRVARFARARISILCIHVQRPLGRIC
ncbi:hypothetical protein BCR44DRAFT_70510 [Catenaria anguillulae PL171]|uniref:Uncharacterized protein n=1 Tax=Catenaria anguillulae PL171 TaxID=765915 RepID=A0A1Y2HEE0_9FUNG|nr:hypothetical protein BCR44DRAFT_70510 [Catenaria anguillulae PL171]